ncbi:unnamed protein product [Choristocarpus tenellus]
MEEKKIESMDEGLKKVLDEMKAKGVSVKDEPGKSVVRLHTTGLGGEKVMVEFDCQEEGDGDEWLDNEDDDEEVEAAMDAAMEDDEDVDDTGYNFLATITKGSDKLVFTGTATSCISLSTVACCPPGMDHKDTSLYEGPVFHELDSELKEGILGYLQERNIDDNMAAFICMYADHKEQSEYTQWLKQIKQFVTK